MNNQIKQINMNLLEKLVSEYSFVTQLFLGSFASVVYNSEGGDQKYSGAMGSRSQAHLGVGVPFYGSATIGLDLMAGISVVPTKVKDVTIAEGFKDRIATLAEYGEIEKSTSNGDLTLKYAAKDETLVEKYTSATAVADVNKTLGATTFEQVEIAPGSSTEFFDSVKTDTANEQAYIALGSLNNLKALRDQVNGGAGDTATIQSRFVEKKTFFMNFVENATISPATTFTRTTKLKTVPTDDTLGWYRFTVTKTAGTSVSAAGTLPSQAKYDELVASVNTISPVLGKNLANLVDKNGDAVAFDNYMSDEAKTEYDVNKHTHDAYKVEDWQLHLNHSVQPYDDTKFTQLKVHVEAYHNAVRAYETIHTAIAARIGAEEPAGIGPGKVQVHKAEVDQLAAEVTKIKDAIAQYKAISKTHEAAVDAGDKFSVMAVNFVSFQSRAQAHASFTAATTSPDTYTIALTEDKVVHNKLMTAINHQIFSIISTNPNAYKYTVAAGSVAIPKENFANAMQTLKTAAPTVTVGVVTNVDLAEQLSSSAIGALKYDCKDSLTHFTEATFKLDEFPRNRIALFAGLFRGFSLNLNINRPISSSISGFGVHGYLSLAGWFTETMMKYTLFQTVLHNKSQRKTIALDKATALSIIENSVASKFRDSYKAIADADARNSRTIKPLKPDDYEVCPNIDADSKNLYQMLFDANKIGFSFFTYDYGLNVQILFAIPLWNRSAEFQNLYGATISANRCVSGVPLMDEVLVKVAVTFDDLNSDSESPLEIA